MPPLGKNQLATTLHMYASIGPNLDNTHKGQILSSSWRHRTMPNVTWPETEKCILTKWLKPFCRIFCTITILKPFRRKLSKHFGLWWKMKKWEWKMCFFDHSFVHNFLTARLRRAVLAGGSFFFLVLSVTNPKPPRMMSFSANDRRFLSSFCHVPPQESFVQLAIN